MLTQPSIKLKVQNKKSIFIPRGSLYFISSCFFFNFQLEYAVFFGQISKCFKDKTMLMGTTHDRILINNIHSKRWKRQHFKHIQYYFHSWQQNVPSLDYETLVDDVTPAYLIKLLESVIKASLAVFISAKCSFMFIQGRVFLFFCVVLKTFKSSSASKFSLKQQFEPC